MIFNIASSSIEKFKLCDQSHDCQILDVKLSSPSYEDGFKCYVAANHSQHNNVSIYDLKYPKFKRYINYEHDLTD